MGLKKDIVNYVKQSSVAVHGGEIERMAFRWGYKAGNAGRRCRELADEGRLDRIENAKGEVMYKYRRETMFYKTDEELDGILTNIKQDLIKDTANIWNNSDKIREVNEVFKKKRDYKIIVINKYKE